MIEAILPFETKEWDTDEVKRLASLVPEEQHLVFTGGLPSHQGRGRKCVIFIQMNEEKNTMVGVQFLQPYQCKHTGKIIESTICWLDDLTPLQKYLGGGNVIKNNS